MGMEQISNNLTPWGLTILVLIAIYIIGKALLLLSFPERLNEYLYAKTRLAEAERVHVEKLIELAVAKTRYYKAKTDEIEEGLFDEAELKDPK